MRKLAAIGTTTAIMGALLSSLLVAQPAVALTPGLAFSADDLPTWQTDGVVWSVESSGNLVLAGGNFTNVRPPDGQSGATQNRAGLVVLNADTGAPASCQFALGNSGAPQVRAMTTSPDGSTVYIAGAFTSVNGFATSRVAALNLANCSVRTNFKAPSIPSMVNGIAASSSAVYIAGTFGTVGGQPRGAFAALSAATGAVNGWVADATSNDVQGVSEWGGNWTTEPPRNSGQAVLVSPDNSKVVLGGDFDLVNGVDSHAMAVVDATSGALFKNFPLNTPYRNTSRIKGLASDGTNFYTGNEGTGGGAFDGRSSWTWSDFTLRWWDACLGATQAVLPYQGTLYAASHGHDCRASDGFQDGKRNYFSAQPTDSINQINWYPAANDGIGEGIGPRALSVATGTTGTKYLYSGGEFTRINGKAQQSLTRFSSADTGSIPAPTVAATANASGKIEVRFRTSVDNDDSTLTYRVYRDGSTTPMWTGTANSIWWSRPQVTVVDETAAPGSTHTYRVTASDGIATSVLSATVRATATGSSSYAAAVVADDPEFFWRYDEASGTWAQDASGPTTTGVSGTYDGPTLGSAGAVDGSKAATFDGTDDYIWDDQLVTRPDVFTVETWINTTTTNGGKIIGFGSGRPRTDTGAFASSGNYDNHVYMDNSGALNFGVYNGGSQVVRSAASYNDGQWHHVAASLSSAGMALYVDGVLVGRNGVTSGNSYKGVWHVGGDNISGWPNQPRSTFFAGSIDETAVYDHALTAQQVASHFIANGGTPNVNTAPTDAYGAAVFGEDPDLYWRLDERNGTVANDSSFAGLNDGTVGNDVTKGAAGVLPGTTAFSTTGSTNSAVNAPRSGAPTRYASELWFNTTTRAGGKLIGYENQPSGNSNGYDKHVYMTNDGKLVYGVYAGSPYTITTDRSYNDGAWHQVVATQDGQGMRLYVDGVLVGTNPQTASETFSGYWRIGGGNLGGWPGQPSSQYIAATIDEVAIYSHSLSAATVASHYAIGVSDNTAPSGVGTLTAQAADGAVQLAWTAATDDHAVAGYRVYRGTSADFAVGDSSFVAQVTSLDYLDSNLPSGTYYYAVRAVDGAGNLGPIASAQATISDSTAPTVPTAVVATANGTSVSVSWTASTDATGVTGYAVYRGTSADFTADDSSRIATSTSTGYTDSNLAAGTYYYRVDATDAAGNRSAASASSSATVAPAAAEPVTVTVSPTDDTMVASTNANYAYGTTNQLSTRGNTAIESYLRFVLPSAPAGTQLTDASLRLRTSNDSTAASTDAQSVRLLTGTWSTASTTWNNRPTGLGAQLGSRASVPAINTTYSVALDAAGLRSSVGSTSLALTASGSDNARFWSIEGTTEAYRPLLTLTYTPTGSTPTQPVGDTTAPTVPGSVTASASGTSANVTWAASSDATGVISYTVYRGSSADFVANSASKLGDATTTSWTDASLAAGTYFYKVDAVDAAGNRSAASAATSVQITAPTTPTEPTEPTEPTVPTQTLTVPITEDSMVAAVNANFAYGLTNQISSRGPASNSPIESYLKAALPAAPAGTVLKSATLQVRTSNDSTAASVDEHTVSMLTGDWAESTVTWTNRPTAIGVRLGAITGATGLDTPYTAALDAAALGSSLGSTVSFALTSVGVDNLRLWSNNAAQAAFRPTLVLTFGPA